jgi:imidazolonepropionase-like amidohydrolase
MRTRFALLLVVVAVFFTVRPSRASDLALTGAKVYPSPTDPPIEDASILVHNGRIVAVGPRRSIKIPRATTIILTVGEPIWTIDPVYIRDFLKQNNVHISNTETPEQAVALVRNHAAKGADGIKLFTGSAQSNGVAVLPLSVAMAAVEEAHRHNLPVFAHPQDVDGVNVAIDSGVDVLAHTVPQSPPWTPEFVFRLKRANLALIPTLTLFDFVARQQHNSDQERKSGMDKMIDELRAYVEAGGEILFGTDIGYMDHYDTALEFELMSQAGMNYQQILASLTTNPARRFHYSDRTGRIARGMEADVVVLSADPQQNATAFSKVRYTIVGGRMIYSEK